MNLRTALTVCLLSLPVVQMHATPSLQDVDRLAGRAVKQLAGLVDNAGAYFNVCRAPIVPSVQGFLSEAVEHAKNCNYEEAAKVVEEGVQNNLNFDLPYAPATTFVTKHMTKAKIVFGVVVSLVAGLVVKRVFFPKKTKKNTV